MNDIRHNRNGWQLAEYQHRVHHYQLPAETVYESLGDFTYERRVNGKYERAEFTTIERIHRVPRERTEA